MAGLPWIAVFAGLAMISRWRGWGLMFTISALCVGAFAGQTLIGQNLLGGMENAMTGVWAAAVSALHSVAR